MTLRVIGAGLPRTGTSSLRDGLGQLLGGPVQQMSEVFAHPGQARGWSDALDGEAPDWHDLLASYVGAVDAPAAMCWRALSTAHPEAIIVLSLREDGRTWHRGMAATVVPRTREMLRRPEDPVTAVFMRIFRDVVPRLDDLDAPSAAALAYDRWNSQVLAEAPPDRLVVCGPRTAGHPCVGHSTCPCPRRPSPKPTAPPTTCAATPIAPCETSAEQRPGRHPSPIPTPRPVCCSVHALPSPAASGCGAAW